MKNILKIAVLAAFIVPSAAQAEKLSLNQLSGYLNQLKSAKGAFTQINPDQTLSRGDFSLKRPGRMRFEYAKPNPALVVASGGRITIFDKKSSAPPQAFPIASSPLGLILRRNVDLNESGMVVAHSELGPTTIVRAQSPKRPELGNIELHFTADPIELRKWIVTDQAGKKTTVVLGALDTKAQLSARLFNIEMIAEELGKTRR